MTESDWIILISVVVGIAILTPVIVYSIKEGRKAEQIRRKHIEEEYAKEPEYEFTQAKVLSKRKDSYYVGIKLSRLVEEYWIYFITEDGVETGYQVREDVFHAIEENQEGTLVTVNGNLFDFGDGQEIEEAEEVEITTEDETSL